MSGYPYDFEFQQVPPAVCNRCGALVQDRQTHDEWHREVVMREDIRAAIPPRGGDYT